MLKIPIIATLAWLTLMLSLMPRTLIAYDNPSCDTPFECYQKALEQIQYARELINTQKEKHGSLLEEHKTENESLLKAHKTENEVLIEKIKQLVEENQRLISQNQQLLNQQQAIITLLEQKTNAISAKNGNLGIGTVKPQTELDVNGTIKADLFKSGIKKFHSYNTIEPDGADKDFYENESCTLGMITAALLSNKDGSDEQAAICVCLHDKKGRGWFCWN
ncbi:secreted protein [Beggiatoa sp. PS]|nr:secreted protein [Beggiatoa sp. PS]